MSDYWVKDAERRADENIKFNEWIERNEDYILTAYIESLDIDNVPDDFISDLYNNQEVE